ncbi:MAG: AmpG family muropeptide MFS transporter [Bradymonadia bacterium]
MWRDVLSKKMAVCLTTGFASGLPLYFLYQTLPIWFRDNQLDLKTIAAFALVSNPYTLKFLWAPVFDHFQLPIGGRRRGWTFVIQILLVASFALFSLLDPKQDLWLVAGLSFLVAFLSACQDIVLDAYRRELLTDEELGLGSSLFTNAYRFSSLVPGSLALILADMMAWGLVHLVIAAFMGLALLSTYWMDEPEVHIAPRHGFRAAVVEPFLEFFRRGGVKSALLLLAFMLLYKLGDSMATALASPFYLDLGFSKSQIGSVVKVASLWSTIVGSLIGGLVMLRIGIGKALWLFGVVQVVSILGFYALARQSETLPIEQIRNVESFSDVADFRQRVSLPPSTADALLEYAYVRENQDFRCEDKVIDCTNADVGRAVYVNEMTQDELIRCESAHGACFSVKQAEFLVNARSQGKYPIDSRELTSIIGTPVMDNRVHLVFWVRNSQLTSTWLAEYVGEALPGGNQAQIEALLSDRYSLSSPDKLMTALSLPKSRQLQFRSLVEIKSDLNTATLNEIGSRPPVKPDPWFLFWVVSFEYLGVGLGTAAFVAFISSITNRQHTATQFALLTSIAAIPRTFVNATTGVLVSSLGYPVFFLLCTVLALPGMCLLFWVAPLHRREAKV